MSLKWIDGWEAYGVSNGDAADLSVAYSLSASGFMQVQAGRYSYGKALRITGARNATTPSLGSASTWIVGFDFRRPTGALTDFTICSVMEDSGVTQGINVESLSDGTLRVRRGGSNLHTTGVVITPDVWAFVELKVAISNSGSWELRVNGSTIASDSEDTQAGSADRIRIHGNSSCEFDNLYIHDGSGAVNNDFAGPQQVKTLSVVSAGDSTEWTPDSGTNYQRVDDVPHDGDSSYVESSTPSATDLYGYEDVSGLSDIKGVMVRAVVRKTGVDDIDLQLVCKSDDTQDDGSAVTVQNSEYQTVSRVIENDPDTAVAWTPSGVNAAQFGVKIAE